MRRFVIGCILCLWLPTVCFCVEAPKTYTEQCASCHGNDGRGKTTKTFKHGIPDLHSKAVQEMRDDDLFESIARGSKHRDYPHAYLYRGLKEKDIVELVKYIRSIAADTK